MEYSKQFNLLSSLQKGVVPLQFKSINEGLLVMDTAGLFLTVREEEVVDPLSELGPIKRIPLYDTYIESVAKYGDVYFNKEVITFREAVLDLKIYDLLKNDILRLMNVHHIINSMSNEKSIYEELVNPIQLKYIIKLLETDLNLLFNKISLYTGCTQVKELMQRQTNLMPLSKYNEKKELLTHVPTEEPLYVIFKKSKRVKNFDYLQIFNNSIFRYSEFVNSLKEDDQIKRVREKFYSTKIPMEVLKYE